MNNTRFYAIAHDLTAKEMDSVENTASMNPFLIVRQEYSFTHTTRFGNKYEIYNYQFIEPNGDMMSPSIGRWRIYEVEKGFFRIHEQKCDTLTQTTWGAGVCVRYADPSGEVKRMAHFDILEALNQLNTLSTFDSWKEYELHEENTKLKAEIENLKSKLDLLKGEKTIASEP